MLKSYLTRPTRAHWVLVLVCLGLIGITWSVAIERVRFERAETVANTLRSNANLALAFEEQTVRTLKGVDQVLLFVRDQYAEHGRKFNIRQMIARGALDAELFRFIGIADERGDIVLGSQDFPPTNLADAADFQVHLRHDDHKMFVGKTILGRITGKQVIPISRRIDKADGSFGGMVTASVDPGYFSNFYQKADLGEQGVIALVGLDGITRARISGKNSSSGDDIRNANLFAELRKSSSGSFISQGRVNGVPHFISYRTVQGYPLVVTVGPSQDEAMALFRERSRRYYTMAGFASVLILLFAAFMLVAWSRQERVAHAAVEQFKLAETFFNHGVGCFVILDRDFNFLRVNAAYARVCRREIGEFAGRNHFEMYPSDTKAIFEEVVRSKRPFETLTRAFTFADQPERGVTYWDWTLAPVLDQQGEVHYLVFSLSEVTERQRAEAAHKQSLHRLQALSGRLMKIQREERDAIARELHDELGQSLTALKVNLQLLEPYCSDGAAEDHLTEALMIVGRSLKQVRGMMLDLRPPALEDLGLAVVLESHLAKQAQTAGWASHFDAAELPGRLHPELEMACFRVAQEALTNVMRHANAKEVWIVLGLSAGKLTLSVRDDGRGFDVTAASDGSLASSFGLHSMHERVRQMGGQLSIHSVPGFGSEVRASFSREPFGTQQADTHA